MKNSYKGILLLFITIFSVPCQGRINAGFFGGIGRGYINNRAQKAEFVPLGLTFSIERIIFGGTFALNLAFEAQHARIVYPKGEVTYAGVLNTAAAGIDMLWIFPKYKFSLGGRGIGYGSLTAKSNQVSRVNDYILENSTFYSYASPSGGVFNIALQRQNKINQLGKNLKMYFGFAIQAFALNFAGYSQSVTTSDLITGSNYSQKVALTTPLVFATTAILVNFNF